jgi:thioredoxin
MIIACQVCGSKNRVDPSRVATTQPVCGKCGAHLPVPRPSGGGKPIEVTDDNFAHVLSSAGDKPVLIDFWATWCPPCRLLAPTIDALSEESGGRYLVGKLDTDHNPETAGRFRINSIPTVLIFRNGQLADTLVGVQPKQAYLAKLG